MGTLETVQSQEADDLSNYLNWVLLYFDPVCSWAEVPKVKTDPGPRHMVPVPVNPDAVRVQTPPT